MASTFAFHPTVNEVVPYSAQYSFPSQATRQSKRTVKLTPKNNAAIYSSGSTIRFEFPASGYLNPTTTYLAFNTRIVPTGGSFVAGSSVKGGVEFQNNIQSIFRRVRVLYGSLVLEDIQDHNILQRLFTDTLDPTGTHLSTSSMYQGIGCTKRHFINSGNTPETNRLTVGHREWSRFNYHSSGTEDGPDDIGLVSRRYSIPLSTGLFQQKNLIPLKFMASQLSIEFEIAEAVDCVIYVRGVDNVGVLNGSVPTAAKIEVGLPELVTELLEFDSDFDKAIYNIMQKGLPIYFQSWHVTTQTVQPNTKVQLNIQESARSVRYALAVMIDENRRKLTADAHNFVSSLNVSNPDETVLTTGQCDNVNQCSVESYQWRLGGTYYPSQPVACYGGKQANLSGVDAFYGCPPVEAYAELMKTFGNLFGDDGTFFGQQRVTTFGNGKFGKTDSATYDCRNFVMAGNFMSDRGDIISGINAEEQNDLQLIITFVGTSTGTSKTAKIITCFDNLIILGESNNMVHVY